MIPLGYMAKKISAQPAWLKAANVLDIYSASPCISGDFADYFKFWKHNGYYFFDSPAIIAQVAQDNAVDLSGTKMFYYEAYEKQYDEEKKSWNGFEPEHSFVTNVKLPESKTLEGYDVVSYSSASCPECSPLSCNSMANEIAVNEHCLLPTFGEAEAYLNSGKFDHSEPGPYRILAVYSIPG